MSAYSPRLTRDEKGTRTRDFMAQGNAFRPRLADPTRPLKSTREPVESPMAAFESRWTIKQGGR